MIEGRDQNCESVGGIPAAGHPAYLNSFRDGLNVKVVVIIEAIFPEHALECLTNCAAQDPRVPAEAWEKIVRVLGLRDPALCKQVVMI